MPVHPDVYDLLAPPKQRMCLSIQHKGIKTDDIRLRKQQIEILQRLYQPEALHLVLQLDRLSSLSAHSHIFDRSVGNVRLGVLANSEEHLPSPFQPYPVPCRTPEDEDGLNGFRAKEVSRIPN